MHSKPLSFSVSSKRFMLHTLRISATLPISPIPGKRYTGYFYVLDFKYLLDLTIHMFLNFLDELMAWFAYEGGTDGE